ncbi:MAG: hypothetical protein WC503_05975 [Candidatus Shapirobacteria bacterium]
MIKKNILLIGIAILIVLIGVFYYKNGEKSQPENASEEVLEETILVSKEYLRLRYQTDNVLINAKQYANYSTWNKDMTQIIKDWENLEKESQKLNGSATKISQTAAANFNLVQSANAYSAKEISNIYDKAPRFKGIATLANHLGVDAKRAQVILDKAQAEISSDVFTEEGDAFETLENTAIVVKDGCKVVGFVGGVVLTGGAAGFATVGTLAQVSTVIVGADLALEVTEDSAQIAFGDRNKVSSFVKDVRTVTEPIATVLTITNIPGNLGSAYGRFDSVMFGLEQFRDTAQEGKVIGIDLTNFEYQKPFQRIRQAKYPGTVSAAEMEMAEVEDWLKSLNKEYKPMTQAEVEEFLKSPPKETEKEEIVEEKEDDSSKVDEETKPTETEQAQDSATNSIPGQSMAGTYSGSAVLQSAEEDIEADESLAVTLQLNESGTGTANVYGYDGVAQYAGNNVSFSVKMKEGSYVLNAVFSGKAIRNGNQTVISGTIRTSMMGVTVATYSWSAQK